MILREACGGWRLRQCEAPTGSEPGTRRPAEGGARPERSAHNEIRGIADVADEKEDSFDAVEVFGPEGAGDEECAEGRKNHDGEIFYPDALDGNRFGDRRDAENKEDVEDVGSDDIAEGEFRIFFEGGDDGCNQFGKRCSEGDDGDGDDRIADSQSRRQIFCGPAKEFAASDKSGKGADGAWNQKENRLSGEAGNGFVFRAACFLSAFVNRESHVGEKEDEKNDAVDAGDRVGKIIGEQGFVPEEGD